MKLIIIKSRKPEEEEEINKNYYFGLSTGKIQNENVFKMYFFIQEQTK